MQELRNTLPDFPIALSSFRYPKYHMNLPWSDFLNHCNFNMPQVYWEQAHNPAEQLDRSISEFETLISPVRPYIATGAAYCAGGWCPTSSDIVSFMDRCVERGLEAVNFWSWDYCRLKLPVLWETIANYEWPTAPNPEKNLAQKYVGYLSTGNIDQLLGLYSDDAVHINAERTIQGKTKIRNCFLELFSHFPTNGTINLLSESGTTETRHITWSCMNGETRIISGTETLGITDNKIIYHYSSVDY